MLYYTHTLRLVYLYILKYFILCTLTDIFSYINQNKIRSHTALPNFCKYETYSTPIYR